MNTNSRISHQFAGNEPYVAHMSQLDAWTVWQHAQRKSAVTIAERVRLINLFHVETGQHPTSATAIDIVTWLAGHTDWSDGTVATYTSYLSSWFKWLQVQGHRLDNPMIAVGAPAYPDRIPRPVDDDDLVRLLASNMHTRTRVMILLGALAGLRVHEIAKVRGEDVEDNGRRLRVVGKGRKVGVIPLHPILQDVAATMPVRGYWFESYTHPGNPVLAKSVSDIVGRAMRRAKCRGSAHSLRHWYGTTLMDDGADLRVVQELLRHKSIATTQVYTRVRDERRDEAVGRLDVYRSVHAHRRPPVRSVRLLAVSGAAADADGDRCETQTPGAPPTAA